MMMLYEIKRMEALALCGLNLRYVKEHIMEVLNDIEIGSEDPDFSITELLDSVDSPEGRNIARSIVILGLCSLWRKAGE